MDTVRTVFQNHRLCVTALLLICAIPLFPEYIAPVLAIISVFVAAADARQRGTGLQLGGVGKLLLVYIAYLAVGVLYSEHKFNSLCDCLMWLVMLLAYITVVTVVYDRNRFKVASFLVTVCVGIVGAIACLQYVARLFIDSDIPNQLWGFVDRIFYQYFPMDVNIYHSDHRVASTFNNPNIMAEYLVMMLPLCIFSGFDGKRTSLQLLSRLCLLFGVFGIALSFSRGAYLALLSMLLLIIVTHLRRITPFLLSIVAAVSLIPEAVVTRFLEIGSTSDSSISQRFAAWDAAIQAVLQHPILGLGPGIMNFQEFMAAHGVYQPHSHNVVLQILACGGFIALFLLSAVAVKVLQNSMDLLNYSPKTHLLGTMFLVFTVSFVVIGMVEFPFLCPKLVGTFLIVLGFLEAACSLYLRQPTTTLSKQHLRESWLKQRHKNNSAVR